MGTTAKRLAIKNIEDIEKMVRTFRSGDGSDKHGRFGVDVPSVHPDTALELMVHHLQLAAAYFEVAPEGDARDAEVLRLMMGVHGHRPPALDGARAFLLALDERFEAMKERD